ncbi:MAG: TolC family protein [Melioribacteraceae bacterium]|nr:TolC family protein [Melioribacteraceae bacterium]MCF8356806.1 TolC family protein [Melioribacteraceae bacterium]MCF8394985.1 TolC family protein [Melioribacteraceae bacterium]MCF8419705.1 TolC family protein [Melioribacteraceae bacterium]
MKSNINKWILSSIILLQGVISGQGLSIDDVISTALNNNREIKIAKMEVIKAEEAVDEAFGYALPSVDLSAQFSHFLSKPKMAFPDFEAMLTNATYGILFDEGVIPYDKNKFLPMDTKLQSFAQTNNFETGATVTQILFNSAVFRGIGASQIYLNLSREQLKSKTTEVILNTKKAFYGVLLTRQMLDITNQTLKNAEENLRNVQSYYEQGLTSEFQSMQAEVMVENIRPKVYELENIYRDLLNKLKMVIGYEQSKEIEVTGEIKYVKEILPGVEEALDMALKSNYDITTLQVKRQVDEEFVALDRAGYWPQLAAFGNFSYAGSSDEWKFQTYNSTTVGISLSMNIFNGGRTSNKVQQSLIGVKQTEEQIGTLRDYIVTEVKKTLNNLQKVQMQIDVIERNVELAERAYKIANTRYKEGTATQLEVKNANLELQTARVNRLQAIHDYIVAKAEFDKLTGRLDDKYLDIVNDREN